MAIEVVSEDQTPTETSPLLGGHQNGQTVQPINAQPGSSNSSENVANGNGGSSDSSDVENITALAEEPSTKKLVAIMAAIWTGVFFAALGMFVVRVFLSGLPLPDTTLPYLPYLVAQSLPFLLGHTP